MGYERIAEALGVTERTLRRWRQLPAWHAEVAALDAPEAERELVAQARSALHRLLVDEDPKVRLGAVRAAFDFCMARRLEVTSKSEVVYMARYDVKGVDPETLRSWLTEAAAAEGIGPGGRALPGAAPGEPAGVVDAEFAEVGSDG